MYVPYAAALKWNCLWNTYSQTKQIEAFAVSASWSMVYSLFKIVGFYPKRNSIELTIKPAIFINYVNYAYIL